MWKSTNLESAPESIFRRGEIRTAVVRGDHLFLAGTLTNEPPSAWNYDLTSGAVDCILSGATHGLKHTECVPFEVVALTNVAGQRFSYHIWKPAHFDPSKKYPLVIGNSPYSWTPFPLAAANTGHYFVTVDRPNWTSPMDDWVEKLMTGYRDVTRNPNIDTNRVMLCVRSIESAGIYDLLAKDAAIWKSAMLLDPASVPPFSRDYFSKVFITAGEFDEPVLENVLKSKKSLEQEGISVNLTILRGAGHVSYGVGVQQQRMAAMVKFLGEE
jgi:hypothetical protein